ncbi:peptidase C39 family protein [Amphritea pacifica]|uniref:peptidase C39 family protein n=1 Tax=Amphritea pacifica TaxID=2811233 RepID=UPI0019662E39|nr:peptidase C39 family protein [Amphritea pacifica]MBN1006999.1 peptidase C39 family protein [Amphritea pacifica]
MNAKPELPPITFRRATLDDLDILEQIENRCFEGDRLHRRSLRNWIKAPHGEFLVAVSENQVVGYGLVWCHKGTRLARLYSLALLPEMRGSGAAARLMSELESATAGRGYLFMRLEVAKSNQAAAALYRRCGYRVFGEYHDYYEDHSDALRMQKTIQYLSIDKTQRLTPWYQQTTPFTCGPAALMMAMASLDETQVVDQKEELDIWRQATTVFMTTGHGGCHPLGLALAASQRGFRAEVLINTGGPLFVDGVRSAHKKEVLAVVHQQFVEKTDRDEHIRVIYEELDQQRISDWLQEGYAVIILISTFRLDGKKAPHWVAVTGIDERCFYVHDPDAEDISQLAIDNQYLPITRQDFDKMSAFGSGRLRTAVAIRKRELNIDKYTAYPL